MQAGGPAWAGKRPAGSGRTKNERWNAPGERRLISESGHRRGAALTRLIGTG
jgi:hypothetical protein